MKAIAFNGSARKKGSTATLLKKTLKGAESEGAETELVHLYDLNYDGCISCLECKRLDSKNYGKCNLEDDLTPYLDDIKNNVYDALFLGSPNYLGLISGRAKMFFERLAYPYVVYSKEFPATLFEGEMKVGFIYTMGAPESVMHAFHHDRIVEDAKTGLEMIFGNTETLISNDTILFKNYDNYMTERFDPEAKAKTRREQFPKDCEKAFRMGQKSIKREKLV